MPIPPRTPLLTLLRLEQANAKYIVKVLEQSANALDKSIAKLGKTGNPVTRMQMEAQRAAIRAQLSQDFSDIHKAVALGQQEAARAASRVTSLYEEQLTKLVADPKALAVIAQAEANRAASGLDAALRRMEGSSYMPLSKSVYKTHQLSLKLVDKKVEQGLLSGWTSKQMAKEVSGLINPNVKGGVSYAANRLARTEINNAFHASAAKRFDDSPIVEGIDWHLSSSHPEGDICDDLAANSPYKKKNVPQKPHPHCYCFITPALPSEEEFLENLFAGKYGDEPWAKQKAAIKPPKVTTTNPKLHTPTDEELAKLSTAEITRQKDAAFKDYWAARRAYTGADRDLGTDPTIMAMQSRLRRLQTEVANRKEAARIRSLAKKAAAALAEKSGKGISKLPTFRNAVLKPTWLSQARKGSNPKGRGWEKDQNEIAYQINCTRVAATMEMRMRGYDVQAGGTPRVHGSDPTKSDFAITDNWRTKDGKRPRFKRTDTPEELEAAMREAAQGDKNARFFIIGAWRQGGAHIWNAELRNGEISWYEGQGVTHGNADVRGRYTSLLKWGDQRHSYDVRFMRVDNLEPQDSLAQDNWVLPSDGR